MRLPALGLFVGALALSVGAGGSVANAGQAPPSAPTVAPLALQVTCEGQGDSAVFRIQIANTASRDTAVVLGFTVPNSQTHVVDSSFDVFAIRPATGADEDYVYVNGKYALVKNAAPWIVSLPAGQTYDLELPLKDFISRLNYSNLDVSVAPGARLVLDARPADKAAARTWTGKIETRIDGCQ